MLKLFGHPDSGHSYKVKLFLEIGEIDHSYEVIDIALPRNERPREFQEQSKFQEVPLLVDDGVPFVQSNSILLHLASKFSLFGGDDPTTLQNCREWLFWEANKLGLCLPQLRSAKRFSSEQYNDGALSWLSDRFDHDINILNQELQDGRSYILGDSVTIADFSLCGYLFLADEACVNVPTQVSLWLERISKLNGWQHPYRLLSGT